MASIKYYDMKRSKNHPYSLRLQMVLHAQAHTASGPRRPPLAARATPLCPRQGQFGWGAKLNSDMADYCRLTNTMTRPFSPLARGDIALPRIAPAARE